MSIQSFSSILNKDHDLAIRLAFIDFKLFYTGNLSRVDVVNEFSVSEITATRIINEYKDVRPDNIRYDNKEKKFLIIDESFSPLIDISAEHALSMLVNGFDKNKFLRSRNLIGYEIVGIHQLPLNKNIVSTIARAIFGGKKIECRYNSANSENSGSRLLSPLVILFDGRNWMFRAYHEKNDSPIKYKNFNFSRVIDVKGKNEDSDHEYSLHYDALWNNFLPMELEINPTLGKKQKNEIRRDYGIPDNEDKVLMTERAAFIWIILNQWAVSYKGELNSSFKFKLNNAEMLRQYGAID